MPLWLSLTRRSAAVLFTLLALAIPARGEPAMWIIKDKDSTIYLLGTIHVLKPDTVWNGPKIKQALGASTEFWMEIADINADTISLLGKYGLDPKKRLSARLNSEQMDLLRRVAEQYTFPVELLEPMKPWYAALTVAMLPLAKAGYSAQAGVDMSLRLQARLEGDKVVGLETMEEQLQMMDGGSESDQIAYLMETLEDVEAGIEELDRLIKAWSEGNLESLADELTVEMKREAPALYGRMFTDRNIRWSRRIATLLKRSGVQFIAVGAGHLIGPDSVQAQLAKRGIKAERY